MDFEGIVKLIGGCFFCYVIFFMEKEFIGVGDFVYFLLDVFRGELYVVCVDVYVLGLFFYEMFFNFCCFDN